MESYKVTSLFLIPENDPRHTFDEDENLPSLPLPDINNTLSCYLESLEPLVTPQEYIQSKKLVDSFKQGVGQVLNEKLKEKAKNDRNWVEKWWEDLAYLQTRQPLLLSSSMTGHLTKNVIRWTYGTEDDQIKHASIFGYFLMQFWTLLRNERLMPTTTADKKTNFSMSQYRRLFNTVRIPGDTKDTLTSFFKLAKEGECPTTVIVLCRGRIFCVNALDAKGNVATPLAWQDVYKKILNICKESGDGSGVGMLTCDMRSNWSKNRKRLCEISERNSQILELIDRSLFVMVLEDDLPETDSDIVNTNICGNYKNRWADKSICILFYKNGRCGTICDHTAFDGIVALTCLYFVVSAIKESLGEWEEESVGTTDLLEFDELKFDVDDELLKEIKTLEVETSKYRDNFELRVNTFDDFGKSEIQNLKFHPDTFVQMCLQLAYVMLHGKPASCYETATTRKFYNGRTETVRSCTSECLEWVASMIDNNRTNDERNALLSKATKKHEELMSEAKENRGCDRHLFGLYCIAMEEGMEIPEIFLDPSFIKSGGGGNFVLSTSCTGYSPLGGVVTPMCENGYGVFYNMLPNSINFMISVNKKSKETNLTKYFESITQALRRMREVIVAARKTTSKL